MSRWISCVRPPTFPGGRLPRRSGGGRARQHAVFGGDPAFAGAAHERRDAVLDRRRAEHFRQSDLDHHRAFGVNGHAGCQPRRPHRVVQPSVLSRHTKLLSFPDPLERLAQGISEVDVPGKRINLLAVHENLHGRDVRQVDGHRVDDGVDRQGFVERSAGVSGHDGAAEIDERVAVRGKKDRPHGRARPESPSAGLRAPARRRPRQCAAPARAAWRRRAPAG